MVCHMFAVIKKIIRFMEYKLTTCHNPICGRVACTNRFYDSDLFTHDLLYVLP